MDKYSFTAEIQVRFRDIDAMGHVNQAVYPVYLEQARGYYYRDVLDLVLSNIPTVIVHQSIDYKSSIQPTDRVEVGVRVPKLGTSSVPMEYEVRRNDGVAATAKTVQVVTDPKSRKADEIPTEWRKIIQQFEGI